VSTSCSWRQWLEIALNNMMRGLSMCGGEQRLTFSKKVYREIYNLPKELVQPGTPFADIVRSHVKQETGRDGPEELPQRGDCVAIIEAVADLARKLGMRSVAEGIETLEQCTVVSGTGCGEVQGYLFSRPIPGAKIAKLLFRAVNLRKG